jgi:hypothetical protein
MLFRDIETISTSMHVDNITLEKLQVMITAGNWKQYMPTKEAASAYSQTIMNLLSYA